MSNMSYCRFQNTARDLDDCENALHELFDGEPLSADELRAAKRLIKTCVDIVQLVADYKAVPPEEFIDKVQEIKVACGGGGAQVIAEILMQAQADAEELQAEQDKDRE